VDVLREKTVPESDGGGKYQSEFAGNFQEEGANYIAMEVGNY
jgi:hypothetical protein